MRPAAALSACTLLLAACDIPTGLPRFESRWVVPLSTTRVGVGELLPAAVTVAGGRFHVSVPPGSGQRTLGQMCGMPCAAFQGVVAPKPAFSDSFQVSSPLPAGLVAATVESASVTVSLSHDLGFDPVRPEGRIEDGRLDVTIRNDGRVVGSAVIDQPFPPGAPIARTIDLAPGVMSGVLQASVAIVSPAGDPVAIDNAAALTAHLVPVAMTLTEAEVSVQQREIEAQPVHLDLTGVDEDLRERVRNGALRLTLDNPFALSGSLELRLRAPASGADIVRAVQVSAGQTTHVIALSRDEMRWLLGYDVEATLTGPVTATGPSVTVRPDQEVTVTPRLDLVIEIGG
ncbi:MAG TPA: hypothetical protein VK936_04755 [Longimicrobiales bacterium]|nr:hypothetical protein [Longimicrobiales bacterium]